MVGYLKFLKTLEVAVKDVLLFVISVEIMALRLGENKNINGIKVKIDDKAHIIQISQLARRHTVICEFQN